MQESRGKPAGDWIPHRTSSARALQVPHSVTLGLESRVPPEEDTDSRLIHQSYKSLL